MNAKLLTIVVPTYNMAEYLPRCLESLTGPEVSDALEVIVVNDGSTDDSLAIASKFSARRPDVIKVIDKKNEHYGSCVNAGFAVATGKYFRMVDSDDWVDTHALISLLEFLKTCESDLVITLRTEYYAECVVHSYERAVTYMLGKEIEYGREYMIDEFRIRDHFSIDEFNMHSMTYKTSVMKAVNFKVPHGICYTDFLYSFYPLAKARTMTIYKLPLYMYFIGRPYQSVSSAEIVRNFGAIVTVLHCMVTELKKNLTYGVVRDNQLHFTRKVLGFFTASLFARRSLDADRFPVVCEVVGFIYENHLENGPLSFVRLSKLIKAAVDRRSLWIFNLALRINARRHPEFVTNAQVFQYFGYGC